MHRIIALITIILTTSYLSTTNGQTLNDSIKISITPFFKFSSNLAVYNKKVELQDNASRFGFNSRIKKGKISFLAATELRLNLVQGGASFNIDNNPNGGFLDVQTKTEGQTISNRIGYLGVDFERYGTLTFGKQWSVYYDITSYTNQFTVFGGTASATYIGGTDGGENGTGRANQAIIYRNKIGPIKLGIQTQVRGGNNDKFVDGYGFSGQIELTKELLLGSAFNRTLLSDKLINSRQINGLNGQPTYYATGLNYDSKKLTFSAVGALQKNGDFAQGSYIDENNNLITSTVVFDARGLELYSKYKFEKFSIHAGYNLYVPKIKTNNDKTSISNNYKINDIIIGAIYKPLKGVQIYTEQRLSFGKSIINQTQPSVFTLGMTVDLSKTFDSKLRIN